MLVEGVKWGKLGDIVDIGLQMHTAAQWNIHIGNDPDWKNNRKCNSKPHLSADYNDH